MDKVSDFLKELGQRFSNPLIFSFIISWTFYNWKVPVALFFFTEDQLKAEGFSSYVDFISKTVTSVESFWHPVGFALTYTIVFPFIREGVKNFNIWVDVGSTRLSKKINSSSSIPMEKYYEMLDSIGQKESRLEQLISSESKLEAENISLKNIREAHEKQIQANVIEVNSLNEANSKLERINSEFKNEILSLNKIILGLDEKVNQSVIQGSWNASSDASKIFPPFEIFIDNERAIIYIDATFVKARIILFSVDRKANLVFFRFAFVDAFPKQISLLNHNWLFKIEGHGDNEDITLRSMKGGSPYSFKKSEMSYVMNSYLSELNIEHSTKISNFIDKDNLHR